MGKESSIVFYLDWINHLSLLSSGDAMAVLQAIKIYLETGEVTSLSDAANMAFAFIRAQIDRDNKKWEDVRRKRREAGRLGAEATNR